MALRERNDCTDEGLVPRALAIQSSLRSSSTQRRMSSMNFLSETLCFIPMLATTRYFWLKPQESTSELSRRSLPGGTRVVGERQPDELHGASLAWGGKGALLTALYYSAVRSHQAVRAAGSPLPKERAEGGTHRPCAKFIDRTGATQTEGYSPECVEEEFCEVERPFYGVLRSWSHSNMLVTLK